MWISRYKYVNACAKAGTYKLENKRLKEKIAKLEQKIDAIKKCVCDEREQRE